MIVFWLFYTDNAATNRAASSSTSLNTKRLDEDTENLARESSVTLLFFYAFCNVELNEAFRIYLKGSTLLPYSIPNFLVFPSVLLLGVNFWKLEFGI